MTQPKDDRPPTGPRSFAEVAAESGVARLPVPKRRVRPPVPAARPIDPAPPRFAVTDEEGWLEGAREGLPRHARRALAALPAATLDLHGRDAQDARRAVASFLRTRRARGDRLVLVIVGRGRRSPGGVGALRLAIATWLVELGAHVLAFRTAAPDLGGDGAVVVLLAPRSP